MFLLPLVASVREESAAASTDFQRKAAARDKHQHEIYRDNLWMTADNRLSLQQPGGRIADEKLGIAA
jgi:hypothetical protein